MGCVDGTPAGLCRLDEFERHRDPGSPGARSLGDSQPQPHGGEGGLDRVGRAEVDPVLGGVVEECEQFVEVVDDLGGGLAEFRAVSRIEGLGGVLGVSAVLGVPDLGQGLLRPGWAVLGNAESTLPIL